jgi:hypothetical protein
MQKNSNSDYDGQQSQVISLDIGRKGLDLRHNDDPDALVSLNNARFTDNSSIERRTGYTYQIIQDGASFNNGQVSVGSWIYGFGNLAVGSTTNHHPISSQCLSTFNSEGNNVSWTGDRLLVHLNDDVSPSLGGSDYWRNHTTLIPVANETALPYGIPCYIPSLQDNIPPVKATAVSTEQNIHDICATTTQYCIVYSSQGSTFAQIINRDTGRLVSLTKLNTSTTANKDPRVVFSDGLFVAYWWDSTTSILYTASFNGITWSAQSTVATSVVVYDIDAPTVGGGYYLIYRVAAVIRARFYVGILPQSSPFASDTVVDTTGTVPNGAVAVSINPANQIGVAWGSTTGVFAREYTSALATKTGATAICVNSDLTAANSNSGLSIVSKSVAIGGNFPWVVYSGATEFSGVYIGTKISVFATDGVSTTQDSLNSIKFNSSPVSRAFRIGNETFIWLASHNSPLYYLVAGAYKPIVCAYADRGTAVNITRFKNLGSVAKDPLDENKVLWVRATVGTSTNANHLLYSVIDFLPQITMAQYGASIYLSGSAVQNFDGTSVSDAGFQEHPITLFGVASAGGSLSAGDYRIRAYAVRYNNKGERFISPALTSAAVTAAGAQKIDWTINTVNSCTATDVIIEVYRTLAGGTTFFFDGTVANGPFDAVNFTSTQSDTAIALAAGDPYQPQVGGLSELVENGPTGCTTIVSYNDRLWCSGGQVPSGQLVFSKIKINGFGAGFSALNGSVVIDSEANQITSIAGINDTLAVFESEKVFLLDTNGPDNFGRGNFSPVKFATKKGATTHFGTMLTDVGLVYWNEGGPYLLTGNFSIVNISENIRPLAITLTPTGVTLNPQRQEVVWYTDTGTALLWDYKSGNRWAQWTNLKVNAASRTALAMDDGRLYIENNNIYNDGGQTYVFSFKTAQLRAEQLLSGYVLLKRYGVTGEFAGEHTLEFRVYYNGSPLWEEREVWTPDTETFLTIAEDYGDLTAEQVDALQILDKSGNYSFNKRAKRQNCQRFQLELLDNAPDGPSYFPLTLEFEIGARPGYGRIATATVTDK